MKAASVVLLGVLAIACGADAVFGGKLMVFFGVFAFVACALLPASEVRR